MGQYLIPGETSSQAAAAYLPSAYIMDGQTWSTTPYGVLFQATQWTDAVCSSYYAGYVPSGMTDTNYIAPLPQYVQNAISDFKAFMPTTNGSITNAQRDALLKDVIRVLFYLNGRISNS